MENIWPPFAVTIRASDDTGRGVDLRVMRDEDIACVAQVRATDIYGANIPEHAFAWLFDEKRNTPTAMAQHRWEHRAQLRANHWTLDFIVRDAETQELVGVVDLSAENFAAAREVETASWVLHRFQGQGYGTLIRQAVAEFSFSHLDAHSLCTCWVETNRASARVSEKMGYRIYTEKKEEPAGPEKINRPVVSARLSTADYHRPDGLQLEVTGIGDQLLHMLS